MAVSDEIKEQTSKFKTMTGAQKRDYIWTYYKWWIIGTIVAVISIIYLTKAIIKNSRPVYLDVIFLNCDYAGNTTDSPLAVDFTKKMGVNIDDYNFNIDYTSYLDNNYGNQKSMASQVKLVSLYSAEEVDICCGPENVMTDSADMGGYYDFAQLFTEEELKKFEEAGYEIFHYTETFPEDDEFYEGMEPQTYAAGIYIDKCESLINDYKVYSENAINQENENGDGRFVLTVAMNSKRVDTAKEFVYFITGVK